jgi:hypothetical protein
MDMREQRFGVEVECVGITRQRAAEAVRSVVGGSVVHVGRPTWYDPWEVRSTDCRTWRVVSDASLTGAPAHLRAEVVTPVLGWFDVPLLQAVVRALRAAGARVDGRCGIHVHVDAKAHGARSLANLVKLVHAHEEHLMEALGVGATRRERFAKGVDAEMLSRLLRRPPTSMDRMNAAWYGKATARPSRMDPTRYHGLNLNAVWALGTIEMRWFPATLHAGRIKAFVQFALALSARAINCRCARAARRSYDPSTTRYDWRVFLLGLGLIGDEFRTARHHLLANTKGSAAWRRAA